MCMPVIKTQTTGGHLQWWLYPNIPQFKGCLEPGVRIAVMCKAHAPSKPVFVDETFDGVIDHIDWDTTV